MPTTLLAIDTATDACSLALQFKGGRRSLHKVIPRQHHQRLFALLDELLEQRPPAEFDFDAIVYGSGPGSFTGLRVAASFAQGLAYSLGVPVVPVSTLETQVHTFVRQESISGPCLVASGIDARVGGLYCAFYRCEGDSIEALDSARLCVPQALALPVEASVAGLPLHCVGTGFMVREEMAPAIASAVTCRPELLPDAVDMLALGERAFARGNTLPAAAALPEYVQERVGWKTLAEQGKKS